MTGSRELVLDGDLVAGAGQQHRGGLRTGGRVYPAEGPSGRQASGGYPGSAVRAAAVRR